MSMQWRLAWILALLAINGCAHEAAGESPSAPELGDSDTDMAAESGGDRIDGVDDVPECAAYFKAQIECHGEGNAGVEAVRRGFEKQLANGHAKVLAAACKHAHEKFTCRNAGKAKQGGQVEEAASGGDGASAERAGKEGTATAYELDGKTVLAHKACPKKGLAFDYVSCGREVRESAKAKICAVKGKGLHKYKYQTGDNEPRDTSVFCK